MSCGCKCRSYSQPPLAPSPMHMLRNEGWGSVRRKYENAPANPPGTSMGGRSDGWSSPVCLALKNWCAQPTCAQIDSLGSWGSRMGLLPSLPGGTESIQAHSITQQDSACLCEQEGQGERNMKLWVLMNSLLLQGIFVWPITMLPLYSSPPYKAGWQRATWGSSSVSPVLQDQSPLQGKSVGWYPVAGGFRAVRALPAEEQMPRTGTSTLPPLDSRREGHTSHSAMAPSSLQCFVHPKLHFRGKGGCSCQAALLKSLV